MNGQGDSSFHYAITSTFNTSVVEPPHEVCLQLDTAPNARNLPRSVAITCDDRGLQILTEEGQVYYLVQSTAYIPRRMPFSPGLHVRRMFPTVFICDGDSRSNSIAEYCSFARFLEAQRSEEEKEEKDALIRLKEQRRIKEQEEWAVVSNIQRIELQEGKEKHVVVKWRCPVWWAPYGIKEDRIVVRFTDEQHLGGGEEKNSQDPKSWKEVLIRQGSNQRGAVVVGEDGKSVARGEVSFRVPYGPECEFTFVYLRKLAQGFEEKAVSKPITLVHRVARADESDEALHYQFPLKPLHFACMKDFIACAPVKTCAKLLVKDLEKVKKVYQEERISNKKSSATHTPLLGSLLLCEDYARRRFSAPFLLSCVQRLNSPQLTTLQCLALCSCYWTGGVSCAVRRCASSAILQRAEPHVSRG